MTTLTVAQAADALRKAGWTETLIPIMVGIGKAESGLRVEATSKPNRNGTIDHGWLQINSVHSQYDVARLISDPVYTAAAGLAIYKSQGLKAWSTYNSGAYKAGGLADVGPAGAATAPSSSTGTVQNVSLAGDAFGDVAGKIGTAVQPVAYRLLALSVAAGLALAGMWRLTKAPRAAAMKVGQDVGKAAAAVATDGASLAATGPPGGGKPAPAGAPPKAAAGAPAGGPGKLPPAAAAAL